MAQIRYEIVIDRPIEFVFKFITEAMPDYLVRLDPNLLIVEQLTEGEVRKDTQFRLISSKKAGERDPTKIELIKGLDLNTLEPDLRKEIKEAFIEVTAFERNQLFETIKVGEDNLKKLERYTFQAVEGSTKLTYMPGFDLSKLKGGFEIKGSGNSKPGKFAFKLFWKPLLKFSLKFQIKDLKTIIEAEPGT
jgi:hypothetical protein